MCVQCASLDILRPTLEEDGEGPPCTSGKCVGDRVGLFMLRRVSTVGWFGTF